VTNINDTEVRLPGSRLTLL